MEKLASLIPLFPLAGFLYIMFFGNGLSKKFTGIVACGAVLLSFVTSVLVFSTQMHGGHATIVHLFDWIHAGDLKIGFDFLVDPLSSIYLLFITGVGFLIHLYSTGYMHDDEGFNRFMAYLNLFLFFMLILVLGDSFVTVFVGWEGVGLCSFMLIGFWYKDMANNDAAKKAFIFNRIGDLGLILGMCLLFSYAGTLSFGDLFITGNSGAKIPSEVLTSICILLFVGAMGKSAQIPLHTWLPDAMAGPTPVSALIHAATMVTAGIYLVARCNGLFASSPTASEFVAWIGIATSFLGATIALTQNDIKKVLAYSTVSQLGLMFAALGLGAYSTAVFHVITHAFFKALLFLGSGSVIHGMGGEQDIRRMGGLKSHMPLTHKTFLIGTIAISGIFPLAGFFSKDQIIAVAFEENTLIFGLSLLISAMTAFYMFRLYFLTFTGKFRGTHDQEHHLHESPSVMTMPLVVLAVLSCVGGFIGLPHAVGESMGMHWHWLDHHLNGTLLMPAMHMSVTTEIILMLLATVIAVGSIYYAWSVYVKNNTLADEDDEVTSFTHKLLAGKYFMDELYDKVIRKPIDALSAFIAKYVNPGVIDGLTNGSGKLAVLAGNALRNTQTGHLFHYILLFIIGLIALLMI
jgi:NADH-quinone oxidoreductase subunit L